MLLKHSKLKKLRVFPVEISKDMAKANVMIDNQKTRVTEWTFEVGDETGQHIHEYDYVVVPLLDGELKSLIMTVLKQFLN